MVKAVQTDESGDSQDLQALFDNMAAGTPPAPPAPPPPRPAPSPSNDSGDSSELEDLFDAVAAEKPPEAPKPKPPPPPPPPSSAGASSASGDSSELEDLFDSVSAEKQTVPAPAENTGVEGDSQEAVFNRLGLLTRQLYDDMRELGVDKAVEDGARQMPDVRERLLYVSKLTEQAADKVFTATDIAKPIQEQMLAQTKALSGRWDKMFANQLSVDEFKMLAADTRTYFNEAPAKHQSTHEQLMAITLAQDFQDLTGQVIKKVADIIQKLESQLLAVLIEAIPPQVKAEHPDVVEQASLMNGPVINSDGRSDVVTSQEQVDDLLESLGF